MLHPDTALHAVRLLGVDAANLMTRLSIYQATIEELIELALTVDERAWEPVMDDEDDHTVTKVMLPIDQQQAVQQILMLIHALR